MSRIFMSMGLQMGMNKPQKVCPKQRTDLTGNVVVAAGDGVMWFEESPHEVGFVVQDRNLPEAQQCAELHKHAWASTDVVLCGSKPQAIRRFSKPLSSERLIAIEHTCKRIPFLIFSNGLLATVRTSAKMQYFLLCLVFGIHMLSCSDERHIEQVSSKARAEETQTGWFHLEHMSNGRVIMLDAAKQAEILHLHFTEKLSKRAISKQVGVNRKTVAKVIKRRKVRTSPKERQKRASILEPYYPQVKTMLEKAPERSGVNMLQYLRDIGYQGGISILRDYVQTIRPSTQPKEAFFKLDFVKGEAAQVDWGEFGDVFDNGTKVHVFVMVLCWSRMLYLEFTLRETLPTLLRCYERALHFFGGRCREYWHDNMSTVVAERIGKLVRFTERFFAYVGFHGFEPIQCGVGKGNEKGRVENGVKLVKKQFWPGRNFQNLDDLNQQAVMWRDRFANRREHDTTAKVVELMFEQERSSLIPLRPEPYDTDDLTSCKVSKFYRIGFESNTYTVPWTLVGKTVTVRADDRHVRIYYGPKRVAIHQREYRRGKDSEKDAHKQGLKEFKSAASRKWQLETLRSFGPHTQRYLELITAGTRSLRHEIRELLCLSTIYGRSCLEQTIGQLLQQGIVGVDRLERVLRLSQAEPKAPPPMELSDDRLQFVPPSPNLEHYNALLLQARRSNSDEDES